MVWVIILSALTGAITTACGCGWNAGGAGIALNIFAVLFYNSVYWLVRQ
jgi:hypothetical protein